MDEYIFEKLPLKESFKCEKFFMTTEYPFSRLVLIMIFNHMLGFDMSKLEDEKHFETLKEELKQDKNLEQIKKNMTNITNEFIFKSTDKNEFFMCYCRDKKEKERFKVFLNDGCFCFKENGIFKNVDSDNLFKNMFNNRTPDGDDLYLSTLGFPLRKKRHGKSSYSCYIIDLNGNLYIHPYRQDIMQHSFISFGGSVSAAGMIKLNNGKIVYLDNRSGHYTSPSKYMQVFFDFMEKNLDKSSLIGDYFDKEFDINRENFSIISSEMKKNKQFGINFYVFNDIKSKEEIEKERIIRNKSNPDAEHTGYYNLD